MTYATLAHDSQNRYSKGSWLIGLGMALLVLSGCATTTTTPSAPAVSHSTPSMAAPDARLFAYGDTDEIGVLLRRIDRRAPSAILEGALDNPGPVDGDFVAQALAYLGTQYKYGGASPDKGFDCSGLVFYIARKSMGLHLPRSAADQAKQGAQVTRNELKRGDLVFFNTMGRRYSHVGIYVGNDRFLHAPSSGGEVRVDDMTGRYWKSRYNGARRLPAASTQLAAAQR